MRILLVVPILPRPDGEGAIPVLLHAQITGLLERNHEVSLVTTVGDERGEADAAAGLLDSGIDAHLADRRQPASMPLRWRRRLRLATTWARQGWPWRTVWFADPGIQPILDRLSARRSFDVVGVEDNAMSVFRLPAGVPAVLTEHEASRAKAPAWLRGPLPGLPRRALASIDWRRWEKFQRAAWERFARIQVYSRADAEAIAALAPAIATRVRVNPFGIILPEPPDRSREDAGTVLFVGNFSHPPNRDAALWLSKEIMPAVRARCPAARLRIVGSAVPFEVLELANEHVEIVADAPSVEPHLAAAAVVVAPVRTGGGMRMKVLEGLAAGKAVVTTGLGAVGYTEFDPEPPMRVVDGAEEMAAATAELLEDPGARHRLGDRARAFAEAHFSPTAWAERLESVYEEACRDEAGARA
jgi:glycosyltransferase involved in cell wall biosynthesis